MASTFTFEFSFGDYLTTKNFDHGGFVEAIKLTPAGVQYKLRSLGTKSKWYYEPELELAVPGYISLRPSVDVDQLTIQEPKVNAIR